MSNKPLWRSSSKSNGRGLIPLRDEFIGPFDDLFNDFANSFFGNSSLVKPLTMKRAYPKVDVYREDKDLVFQAAVPGMSREELSVSLEDGILSISGNAQSKQEQSDDSKSEFCSYIKELKRSSFIRRFTLPSELSISSIESAEAKLENGVLEIRFSGVYGEEKKAPEAKAIPIK